MTWSDEDFEALENRLVQMGINPSQIFRLRTDSWEIDPDTDPGRILGINHELSDAMGPFQPDQLRWVDYWILRKDLWGLIRLRIDENDRFVVVDPAQTPGSDEPFFLDGIPELDEIAAKIWLTTALFLARAFFPSASNSSPLASRPESVPFWAIGRFLDFVKNANNVLMNSPADLPLDAASESYRTFLAAIPQNELKRLLEQIANNP